MPLTLPLLAMDRWRKEDGLEPPGKPLGRGGKAPYSALGREADR